MADVLKSKLGRFEESVDEYKNALKLLDKSPVEKIYCLQKLILTKIEMGKCYIYKHYNLKGNYIFEFQKIMMMP